MRCERKQSGNELKGIRKTSFNFRGNSSSWSLGEFSPILQTFKGHRNSSCRNSGLHPKFTAGERRPVPHTTFDMSKRCMPTFQSSRSSPQHSLNLASLLNFRNYKLQIATCARIRKGPFRLRATLLSKASGDDARGRATTRAV